MGKHITVILRNAPGQFAYVAHMLHEAKINILAFHVASAGFSSGYAQLVCDDPIRAMAKLTEALGNYVYESEVIAVRTPHVPGSLSPILQALYQADVNVENAYQTLDGKGNAIIIIEPSQSTLATASTTLRENSYDVISDFRCLS
jgi:hypothetical protein